MHRSICGGACIEVVLSGPSYEVMHLLTAQEVLRAVQAHMPGHSRCRPCRPAQVNEMLVMLRAAIYGYFLLLKSCPGGGNVPHMAGGPCTELRMTRLILTQA